MENDDKLMPKIDIGKQLWFSKLYATYHNIQHVKLKWCILMWKSCQENMNKI